MNYVALRQVPYRPWGTTRLFWAFVILQREGLTLLWVRSPNLKLSSSLVIASENVAGGFFEDAPNVSRFPTEEEDLASVGEKCQALGESLSMEAFRRLFRIEDEKGQE